MITAYSWGASGACDASWEMCTGGGPCGPGGRLAPQSPPKKTKGSSDEPSGSSSSDKKKKKKEGGKDKEDQGRGGDGQKDLL